MAAIEDCLAQPVSIHHQHRPPIVLQRMRLSEMIEEEKKEKELVVEAVVTEGL